MYVTCPACHCTVLGDISFGVRACCSIGSNVPQPCVLRPRYPRDRPAVRLIFAAPPRHALDGVTVPGRGGRGRLRRRGSPGSVAASPYLPVCVCSRQTALPGSASYAPSWPSLSLRPSSPSPASGPSRRRQHGGPLQRAHCRAAAPRRRRAATLAVKWPIVIVSTPGQATAAALTLVTHCACAT